MGARLQVVGGWSTMRLESVISVLKLSELNYNEKERRSKKINMKT